MNKPLTVLALTVLIVSFTETVIIGKTLFPKSPDDYEYLIVCPNEFADVWGDFIEFNKQRAMRTKIARLQEDILPSTIGIDDADKLRNYIKMQLDRYNIVFVLLVGDAPAMPHRELYFNFYDPTGSGHYPERYIAADIYFECLDGTWNADGDKKYGEPGEEDMFAEVYVGRIPCDNAVELQNWIHKNIQYSIHPVGESINNVLSLGEYLWSYPDSSNKIWGGSYCDLYFDKKDYAHYTTYGIPANNFNVSQLYERDLGINGWDKDSLKNRLDLYTPAIIVHEGHANASLAMKLHSQDLPAIFTSNGIDANFPIIISGAGQAGQFTVNDCFYETMLTMSTGAVATVCLAEGNYQDDDAYDGPGCRIYRYVNDALFNPAKRVHFLGAMHAMSKEANADIVSDSNSDTMPPYYGSVRYACYNSNLLGDPALSVWTKKPETSQFRWSSHRDYFSMETPPFTWVALADPASEEIFTTQLTGYNPWSDISFIISDSTCFIDDEYYKNYIQHNQAIKVFVKAHNHLPYSFTIEGNNVFSNRKSLFNQIQIKNLQNNISIIVNFAKSTVISLAIFNLKGSLIKSLAKNKKFYRGTYTFTIKTCDVSHGIYLCKLETENNQTIKSFCILN